MSEAGAGGADAALEEALQFAMRVIESYALDIRTWDGGALAAAGFCQGAIYRDALNDIRLIARRGAGAQAPQSGGVMGVVETPTTSSGVRSLDEAMAYCRTHGYEVEFAVPARQDPSGVHRVHLCWMRQDVHIWDANSLDRALEAAISAMDAIRAAYGGAGGAHLRRRLGG